MDQPQKQPDMQEENLYLERTVELARRQWQLARQKRQDQDEAIQSAHEDMLENVAQDALGLRTAQGFDDLMEMSQYTLSVLDQMSAREKGAQEMAALQKMMDSPYFARIDFRFEWETLPEKIYIGRATLMDQKTYTMYVHDWRTPIASVFYRCGTGPASYQAPEGAVTGEVALKRQYEIHGGRLAYYFDADVQITDAYLRQLLSRPTSPKMKTIVETIQKDQDIVIRDMENDVLMVQGAAGSGKTSIALHRVAYLLYQGLSGRLQANDILILSPNTVFEEYISKVLPDLGENNVRTMLFEEIFHALLPAVPTRPRSQCVEELLSCREDGRAALMKSSAAFKGSGAFAEILNRLAAELPEKWIPFADIAYDGQVIAQRELSKAAICHSRKIAPLAMKLKGLEQEILEKVHALHGNRMRKLEAFALRYPEHALEVEAFARLLSIRESAALLKEIKKFTEIGLLDVYRRLFGDKETFYRLAAGIALPENIEKIRSLACKRLEAGPLWQEDAQALFYLHLKVAGCGEYTHFRQVVLDEAQDEHPLYFAILRELFPYARFTILGDVNQTIAKQADTALYAQISAMLSREKSALMTLNKSFRCTMEIWRFSARFLPPGASGECFSRSGEEPAIHRAGSLAEMEDMLIGEVHACREKGYPSIALITKTEREAAALAARLKGRLEARLLGGGALADIRGTLILPIYLAKGLEFDAVLICGADRDHYSTEDDKKLLYIASTRALNRLNVFYTGTASPLL